MTHSKAALRADVLARRRALAPEYRDECAAKIALSGLELAQKLALGGTIALYWPIRGELDPLPLLAKLAEAGFATALPTISALHSPLHFARWKPGEATAPGLFDIPEPLPTAPKVTPDLIFVPLAGFDRLGWRLGYGGGFYDRTLAQLRGRGRVFAVGLAFSTQEIARLPVQDHDASLDFVLTEREIFDFQD
jgi:5-formyltetrahydrofolate cyclo-ligase